MHRILVRYLYQPYCTMYSEVQVSEGVNRKFSKSNYGSNSGNFQGLKTDILKLHSRGVKGMSVSY